MRKLALTALMAVGLVILGASPALADGSQGRDTHGTLNLWCTPDKGDGLYINGTLTVHDGSSGDVTLLLAGGKNAGWKSTSQGVVIHTVRGQTTYTFQFDAGVGTAAFDHFRVDGDGTSSRVVNRDECGFRVPEAPSSALLILGGLPVVGVVGLRVAGIRLPRPNWRRIA